MLRFITDRPWDFLTQAVKKAPNKCHIAVAYFGQSAGRLLPLRRGSVLVLDFSPASVKAGNVCPVEVIKLIKRGVKVHSVQNLHAKVFVVGNRVFVGSTNVSHASADALIEAIMCSNDATMRRQACHFINGLLGEHVTLEYAGLMKKLYRPPRRSNMNRQSPKLTTGPVPKHPPTWVVQLARIAWDKEDHQAQQEGRPTARHRLRSSRDFEVEDFCWSGAEFGQKVRSNQMVVQVLEEKSGNRMVSPPERVLHIQKYRVGPHDPRAIIFTEKPKHLRRKSLQHLESVLGNDVKHLKRKKTLTRVRNACATHRIFQLWKNLG